MGLKSQSVLMPSLSRLFLGRLVAQVKTKMGTKCKTFSHSVPIFARLPNHACAATPFSSLKEDFARLPNHACAATAVGVAEHGRHNKGTPSLTTLKFTVEASSVFQCWLPMRNHKMHQRNAEPWRCYAKVHCGSIISVPMLVANEKSQDAPKEH